MPTTYIYCNFYLTNISLSYLTRNRGLNPPPLGGWLLGWGLNPHPNNPAWCAKPSPGETLRERGTRRARIRNSQFSILNSQLI
jgi:hypothetical protein